MTLEITGNYNEMEPLNDNDLALIEDFLNGQLSPAEANKVTQRIGADDAFAGEVEWMRKMMQLRRQGKAIRMLDAFQEIHAERKRKQRVVRMAAALAVAASLVIFLMVFLKIGEDTPAQQQTGPIANFPIQTPSDTEQISAGPKAQKLPADTSVKTAPESSSQKPPPIVKKTAPKVNWDQYVTYKEGIQILGDDSALGEARALMDEGKRKEALPLLEKYFNTLTPEEEDFDLRLEAGKIYLKELKNYSKAEFHFKKVADGDVIQRYKMEAQFYLACTYLAQGKPDNAKKLLQTIDSQDIEPWKTQASSLLDTLQLHFAGELNR